ncbi:MAG TPA: LuxR C-terminal-related transcriptional regulator [Candidatus Methylacidiphilales bacterium]
MPPVTLQRADIDRVHHLWDELAGFSPAQSDQALAYLIETVCDWVRADNARWHAGVRLLHGEEGEADPLRGWRMRFTHARLPRSPQRLKLAEGFERIRKDFDPGMAVRALVRRAGGAFHVTRLRDGFIDFKAFSKTPFYDAYYRGLGIRDRMWLVFPLSSEASSVLVLDRHTANRSRAFTEKDAVLAGEVWKGLRWFHRQLLLGHGLLGCQTPLSPTPRRVLQELLTGKPEKEIAFALNQSPGTTHQYVKGILRHFGVTSRASLMALWLGGR